MTKTIVIAGPTSSGKSALAISVSEAMGGELICADSRQIYTGMRIGTSGPTDAELSMAFHHGYETISPLMRFGAGDFASNTNNIEKEVLAKKRIPIIVGGSGLYLRCWALGFSDVPRSDFFIKKSILELLDKRGSFFLYKKLRETDGDFTKNISANDHVRIIRAIEVLISANKKPSILRCWNKKNEKRKRAFFILLHPDKNWLTAKIKNRTNKMLASGLVDEARILREKVGPYHSLLNTIGYKEALMIFDKVWSRKAAYEEICKRQITYAKRQITWFNGEKWWRVFKVPDLNLKTKVLDCIINQKI